MAATFYWTLRYGSSASTKVVGKTHTATGTETQESGMGTAGALDRIDFFSIDTGESVGGAGATRINYYDYPIRAGQNSYERWVRAHWDFEAGVTNKITGVYFWMSSGANTTGASIGIYGKVTGTYTTPSTGTTIIGANSSTTLVPTGSSSAADTGTAFSVTFSGGAATELTSGTTTGGYSDYIVLQLRTTSAASPGNVEVKTFSIQYDES